MLEKCTVCTQISLCCHFCFSCKLLYRGVTITYHSNHRVVLLIIPSTTLKYVVFYPNFLSYIPTIPTPWLYKKSYKMKQMNTVITGYIDCARNSSNESVHVVHVAVKTEHVCRHDNHYMHFTKLWCRYPQSTVSFRAWSEFFRTVRPGF